LRFLRSPHERRDMRDNRRTPGYRFAHPGYRLGHFRSKAEFNFAAATFGYVPETKISSRSSHERNDMRDQ
jgi:hypothetical protein